MAQPNRWMMFVDGENLTLQGQKVAEAAGLQLQPGPYWRKDVFLWVPGPDPVTTVFLVGYPGSMHLSFQLEQRAVRSHFYTALVGSEETQRETEKQLRDRSFEPRVFRKVGGKSKGVDIALTTDMLAHAYRDNYDLAVLIAGDRDYLPLVQEVKRLGKVVCVFFFAEPGYGLNPELRVAADRFGPLDQFIIDNWRRHLAKQPGQ
ncbi:MAG: NYN domain-containing protein [Candidatus Eisenbacteria sp.]|nr:NYN domain-containing protein [Candidatus Eisenbacteria bacterium]